MRVLAAFDKFRGTATAGQLAGAVADAAAVAGWECDRAAVADGGEGLLDCFGGANRDREVTGPAGTPLRAQWRLDGELAVVETARASGLAVAGPGHDPVSATTRGTGELIAAAVAAGAREVIVGAGGSATTDGGQGAVEVLAALAPLDGSRGYRVRVAADVRTGFLDAARVFAPQKGADAGQVELLARRLRETAAGYRTRFGVDVTALSGSGAAGGLAGGLAALGAGIEPGFALVADRLDLVARVRAADLVVTGEGRVDATSVAGKAVGALAAICVQQQRRCRVLAGSVAPDVPADLGAISIDLALRFGLRAAYANPLGCVRAAASALLGAAPG